MEYARAELSNGESIQNVAGFIQKIEESTSCVENENYILAYRGEPKIYPSPCRPGLFRWGKLAENEYFEKNLFNIMRQNNLTSDKNYLENAIDAQHGEFLSRLLDVSYNCLIALYFAVTPYYKIAEEEYDREDGAVYVFYIDEIFSPAAGNIRENYGKIVNRSCGWMQEEIFHKNHKFIDHIKLNPRIIAQQGAFILFQGDDPEPLPLCMYRMVHIPANAKKRIRNELKQFFNIHTGSIYPEISNLVNDITNRSKFLNSKPFTLRNELALVVARLVRELDFYLENALSAKSEGNETDICCTLTQAERTIDSYRRGLIHMTESLKNDLELQKDMNWAFEQFNREILLFTCKLEECDIGRIDAAGLLIPETKKGNGKENA